jgi:tRNA U38,U39,U40 pseudouridine synthase TruA
MRPCAEEEEEIDYVQLLNRVLPDDIRVTAWAPVQPDFRFGRSAQRWHSSEPPA